VEWTREYEDYFWKQVRLHPDWRDQPIESERKRIVRMIFNRTDHRQHPAAVELAAAMESAVLPKCEETK